MAPVPASSRRMTLAAKAVRLDGGGDQDPAWHLVDLPDHLPAADDGRSRPTRNPDGDREAHFEAVMQLQRRRCLEQQARAADIRAPTFTPDRLRGRPIGKGKLQRK